MLGRRSILFLLAFGPFFEGVNSLLNCGGWLIIGFLRGGVVVIPLIFPNGILSLRKSQQTPGTYPSHPKIQIWKDFLQKQVVEGLGYVPGVCWRFLRLRVLRGFPPQLSSPFHILPTRTGHQLGLAATLCIVHVASGTCTLHDRLGVTWCVYVSPFFWR